MPRIYYFFLITITSLVLSGCNDEKSEAWYKKHPDETYVTYSKCLKNGESSNNCEFAMRAAIMFAQQGKPEIKKKFENLFIQEANNRKKLTQ
ncbi:TPA: EexN family lipoprotein [Salmonella enterica subsp. enterica serovar Java]|nr:EexN family lipoprotein [Salmonella enterica subsp. diarizonae]EHO7201520.1 EexN family lipoprotein [Salmonella enterica]